MNEAYDKSRIEKLQKILLDIMRHNNYHTARFEISVDVRRKKFSGKIITTEQRVEAGARLTVIREDPF